MKGGSTVDLTQLVTAEARAALALDNARQQALAGVLAWGDAAAAALHGDVPLAERLGWASKSLAAQAVLAGKAKPRQRALIAAEAAVTGEEPAALAARIVARDAACCAALARLTGLRRKAGRAIAAAATPDEAAAVLAALHAEVAAPGVSGG
ncbi:hypothetical protein GEU84_019140 [Fertoebacter nigrum]|uniref:Uncharacterized protein n=1 Tax=Fertoeibacter niger TaxID=2656921 RepID=A0A8X8H2Q6_9RHOB|nr:hypothetical protein [Fertoeibacter niger]NUB46513.1 hypothetical protein [Fertoeibacter niger]